ncbi:MAG: YihY/virulence factor BrkB family protein, partial [Actinobacteria bacterium]|nr:YihY/virulence factor BrkB family protein [Actinomycetota bacterium]MCA1721830.1 YihY/virulence factor BrkB family protein [Actinomycetota bacterium]
MSVITKAKSGFVEARKKRPFLDHLLRMYGRYQADGGDRLAAGVTFYWFLSLFPILLLAISILGFVYGDAAASKVSSGLEGYLPAQLVETIGMTLEDAKGKAGVFGLLGLLLSGLGWIDGLREAIRSIWHQNIKAGNLVTRKLVDIIVLVGLFATIAASIVISGATTAATSGVLHLIGFDKTSTVAELVTQALAYLLAGVADTVLFLYMFTRLPKLKTPILKVLKAAVFGAVGFEILKFVGAFYVARTTSKGEATYGAFAVVVGLLLFLNLVSRLILLTAAFAVTKPYDSDVPPSGTADRASARKAGIPEEYADNDDPDNPPTLLGDGSPSPLRAAIADQTPPQDVPEGRDALTAEDPVQAEANENDRMRPAAVAGAASPAA